MHLATFSKSDAGKLIAHDERAIGPRDHIDPDGPVYDLAPAYEGGPQAKFESLLKGIELSVKSRPLASWMVTIPKGFPAERGREFFKASYDFLAEEVGEENVVSCFVHLDEPGARAHMAFKFVPRVDTPVMTNDKTQPLLWTAKDEKKNPDHKAGTQKKDSKGTLKWERVPKLDADGNPVMRHTAVASKMFSRARMQGFHQKMEDALCEKLEVEKVGLLLDEDDEMKEFSDLKHDEFVRVTAAKARVEAETAKAQAEADAAAERLEGLQQQESAAQTLGEKLESRAESRRDEAAAARARTRELADAVERERGRALGLERDVGRARGRVSRLEKTVRRVISAVRRVPAALEIARQAMPKGFWKTVQAFEDGLRAAEVEDGREQPEQEELGNSSLDELYDNYVGLELDNGNFGSGRGAVDHDL